MGHCNANEWFAVMFCLANKRIVPETDQWLSEALCSWWEFLWGPRRWRSRAQAAPRTFSSLWTSTQTLRCEFSIQACELRDRKDNGLLQNKPAHYAHRCQSKLPVLRLCKQSVQNKPGDEESSALHVALQETEYTRHVFPLLFDRLIKTACVLMVVCLCFVF